jgi:hypothetical protein
LINDLENRSNIKVLNKNYSCDWNESRKYFCCKVL